MSPAKQVCVVAEGMFPEDAAVALRSGEARQAKREPSDHLQPRCRTLTLQPTRDEEERVGLVRPLERVHHDWQ